MTPELEAMHKANGDVVVNGRLHLEPGKAITDNDEGQAIRAEITKLSQTATSIEDIPDTLIVRAMMNMLLHNKRPSVQRQILRDLAELKGMLKKRAGQSIAGVQEALDKFKS